MIESVAYKSIKDLIEAIPKVQIKTCTIPLSVYLQEAEYLYDRTFKDLEQLARCAIGEESLSDFKTRIEACRAVYLTWVAIQKEIDHNQIAWRNQLCIATEFKTQLIHTFFFAFRNDPLTTKQIKRINKGSSHASLIQSLSDLSVLGLAHLDVLKPFGITHETLSSMSQLISQTQEIHMKWFGYKTRTNTDKILRDKSYTYLKERVDEIRTAGKFLFWKDKKHLKEYASAYVRNKNKRYAKEKETSI
jgi:hypothetical protein